MNLAELKPDAHNANKGTARGRKFVKKSLEQYGAGRSILLDRSGNIIAGNKTVEGAIASGMNQEIQIVESDGTRLVAVQRTDLDINDRKARELAIADNRASEVSLDWDLNVLKDFGKDIDLGAFWDTKELEELLGLSGSGDAPEPKLDQAAALCKKWKVKTGQLWEISRRDGTGAKHRLLCGDSTQKADVGRLWGKERADAVLTDPPYGINREGIANDDPKGLQELFRGVIALLPLDNAVIVAFQSPRLFWVWLNEAKAKNHKFERMLWLDKVNDETFPWRGWLMKSEAILLTSVGKPKWNDVHPYAHDSYRVTSVGKELPKEWGKVHASVKPIEVVTDLATRICKPGNSIYDPFIGSGTTMVAAEKADRICYGIELEPSHVAVTLERLSDMGLKPELTNA